MKEKKTKKKILFSASDPRVAKVAEAFAKCGRRGAAAAAYAIAGKYVKLYELAEEKRSDKVRVAYGAGALWAKGTIKMPEARVKILAAHSAARAAYSPVACAAARAVAQAVSTVHTSKHAMGVVCYGLTAIALAKGGDVDCAEIDREVERMLAIIDGYAESEPSPDGWAEFMLTKEEKLARKQKAKEAAGKGDLDFSSRDEIYTTLESDAKKHAEPRKKKAKKGDGEAAVQTDDAAQRQSTQDVSKSKDKTAAEPKSEERLNTRESKPDHDATQQQSTQDVPKAKDKPAEEAKPAEPTNSEEPKTETREAAQVPATDAPKGKGSAEE